MYKNLSIWNDSIELIKKVYETVELLPKSEEYNLKSQIKRAAISVALNIAEGKNRQSTKDFAHFLNVSVASLGEVEACIIICRELGFLENTSEIYEMCQVLIKRINALRNSLLNKKGGNINE